jgi:hypothetical protein
MAESDARKQGGSGPILLRAFAWGTGVALGVALGGWLTVVGSVGAPGAAALDPWSDLMLYPLGAFGVVFAAYLVCGLLLAAVRRRRSAQ